MFTVKLNVRQLFHKFCHFKEVDETIMGSFVYFIEYLNKESFHFEDFESTRLLVAVLNS